MPIAGIDFGTTNVRIATFERDADGIPQRAILAKNPETARTPEAMPTVIALQRQDDGTVSFVVGEDADQLPSANGTLVIRNIKRLALANDSYVRFQFELRQDDPRYQDDAWPPDYWNSETRSVEFAGQSFPVGQLVREILAEAIRRAGINDSYEWRAGCPVHSGLDYRLELASALSQINGQAKLAWLIEEPTLLLTMIRRIGSLAARSGTYLVYDLGGGSFDSVLAEINPGNTATPEMLIFAAEGDPLLGGSDIDRKLGQLLDFNGDDAELRLAKERVLTDTPAPLSGNKTLSHETITAALDELRFVRRTSIILGNAYSKAKVMSARRPMPDAAEESGRRAGGSTHIIGNAYAEIRQNFVDGIIVSGGPTRSPDARQPTNPIVEGLRSFWGNDKVQPIAELAPGIANIEIVGISMGACYAAEEAMPDFSQPRYADRWPIRIDLHCLNSGKTVGYTPYEHLALPSKRAESWKSVALIEEAPKPPSYQVTITDPDGALLRLDDGDNPHTISGYLGEGSRTIAGRRCLEIDQHNRVLVTKETELQGSRHRVIPNRLEHSHLITEYWKLPPLTNQAQIGQQEEHIRDLETRWQRQREEEARRTRIYGGDESWRDND